MVNWMHSGEADEATDLFVKEAVGTQSQSQEEGGKKVQ